MGSGRMMGFIDNVAPSAVEMKPEESTEGGEIPFALDKPPLAFVFKTLNEQNLGKMSFMKVVSGEVKIGSELVNQRTGNTEHIHQLFIMDGNKRNPVDKLVAGDIGATLN